MKRTNNIGFWVIMAVYFGLLLMKAFRMPVTNDETPTAVAYYHYGIWELMMYPEDSPNNHILNTILTKLCIEWFGNEQIVIRLPSLLAFLVYGWAVRRILKLACREDSFFVLPLTLLFVSNPYLLSFFSLSRGYGMSMAFSLLSASFLVSAYTRKKPADSWIAFFLSMLASYANFTLLVFWVAVTALVWFYHVIHQRKKMVSSSLLLFLFSAGFGALIAQPLMKMQAADAFQFWTSQGFYRETIYPLIEYSRNGSRLILNPDSHLIAALVFLVLIIAVAYTVLGFIKGRYNPAVLDKPVAVTAAVVLLTAAVNMLQVRLLGTPNLHGRTALFFYPLFVSVVASLAGLASNRLRVVQGSVAFLLAFICVFHMADQFRFTRVKDWWHDAETFEVLQYLKEENGTSPVRLKTNWMCHNSFLYYAYTGKTPWLELENYDKSIDPETRANYYYVFLEDAEKLDSLFLRVKYFGKDRVLMQRKEPGPDGN